MYLIISNTSHKLRRLFYSCVSYDFLSCCHNKFHKDFAKILNYYNNFFFIHFWIVYICCVKFLNIFNNNKKTKDYAKNVNQNFFFISISDHIRLQQTKRIRPYHKETNNK